MRKSENLTAAYDNYAVYLPSLQQGYAQFASYTNTRDSVANPPPPKGFSVEMLDYLDSSNPLWHCGYTLYSVGRFSSSNIKKADIIRHRDASTVVVGDSGGYQVGTGKLKGTEHLKKYKGSPNKLRTAWNETKTVERVLRWLDTYTDYAMTLDMPIWVKTNALAKDSPFNSLSFNTLIEMSVENLRYFADHRRGGTKFLNVLQDVGVQGGINTGNAWFDAVKDFPFEGWAFGSETKANLVTNLKWMRRLLDEGRLEGKEWMHILAASPPICSVIYSAMQRALRDVLSSDIRISYDSSSPFQMGGVARNYAVEPQLGKDLRTWKVSQKGFPFSPKYMDESNAEPFPSKSPLANMFSLYDMHRHRTSAFESKFFDSLSEAVLTNHNIYMYHQHALQACDLAFVQKDYDRIPNKLIGVLECIDTFFKTETPSALLKKHANDFILKKVSDDEELELAANASMDDFLSD